MACLSLVVLALGAPPAPAQPFEPEVTTEEFRCMSVTSRATQKFMKNRFKCITKCFQRYWRLQAVETECLPPYSGETLECLEGVDGTDAKLTAAIMKKCDVARGRDCPECYDDGDCSETGEAGERPDVIGPTIDSLVDDVFCERASASPEERDCQLKTSKYLGRLVRNAGRCSDVCVVQARAGAIDFAECLDRSSPTMSACLATLAARPIHAIYVACHAEFDDPDGCSGPYPTAAEWSAIAETLFVPPVSGPTYCAE